MLLGYREISFVAVPVYVSLVVLYESFTSVIQYDYVEYLNGNKHRDRLKMFLRFFSRLTHSFGSCHSIRTI